MSYRAYRAQKSPWEKFSGIFAVVAFHAVVVYGLIKGLNKEHIDLPPQVVETKVIEDEVPLPEEAPPPPPPEYIPPPPDYVPPPDFDVAVDVAPVATTNAITTTREAPPTPPPTQVVGARTPKKGLSRPPYPSSSERLGEEGVVGLSLYLDAKGKVSEGKIDSSSGFERLDQAALKHALREWKFEPCMNGSQPVPCWHQIRFRFALKDARGG